jgi:CheY-like chemotaxis protein
MDAATLARAAEPFFTTKGIGKGTGLGLSMVHGLMEQSGGRMALRSEKGKGTTATLFFPVAQQTESMEDTELTIEEQGQSYQAQQQLQVLIVDDDPLILANIGAMLEDIGHQPIEAASGKEAIRILEERREIDLVVTDQTMPEMTGLELVRAIHEMDVNIPVILATGYTDLAGVQPPDLQLLRKPFLQQDLAAAISTALRNDYS